MALSVKHKKVSAIPDTGDPSQVLPSDWNDDHVVTGLGTAAEANSATFASAAQGANGLVIVPHRGCVQHGPENTMVAFQAAYNLGYRTIECDLQLTSDKVPVAIHDASVARTTNGCGLVSSFTLERLQQLDASSPYKTGASFAGRYAYDASARPTCRIPAFEEVLEWGISRLGLLFAEIKNDGGWTQEDVNSLVGMIEDYGAEDIVVLQSFEIEHLQWVREQSDSIAVLNTSISSSIDFTEDGFVAVDSRARIAETAALGGRTYLLCPARHITDDPTLAADIRAAGIIPAVATLTASSGDYWLRAIMAKGVKTIMADSFLGGRP